MGKIVEVGASAKCSHGGSVSISPGSSKVKVDGKAAAIKSDTFTIAGCTFTIPPSKPSPCTKIKWLTAATKVKIEGQAAILSDGNALCQSAEQAPQGPPTISSTQTKVKAK